MGGSCDRKRGARCGGARALARIRNSGSVPLICPTSQVAFRMRAAACCLAWGCFRCFAGAAAGHAWFHISAQAPDAYGKTTSVVIAYDGNLAVGRVTDAVPVRRLGGPPLRSQRSVVAAFRLGLIDTARERQRAQLPERAAGRAAFAALDHGRRRCILDALEHDAEAIAAAADKLKINALNLLRHLRKTRNPIPTRRAMCGVLVPPGTDDAVPARGLYEPSPDMRNSTPPLSLMRGRAAPASRAPRRYSGAVGNGGRSIEARSVSSSMKVSACRRNSSATIGGFMRMLDTTVMRQPSRCTDSTSRLRSPSPENKNM